MARFQVRSITSFQLALLLAIALGSTSLYAQSFSTPVKVSGSTAAHSPMMQAARNGDLYVAWYANAADIYFARSEDRGATFTAPIQVSRQVTGNIYTSLLQRTPRFVVDTKGVIHMVWTEERLNGQNDVWYVRSTDRGNTWSQPVSIMDPDDSAKYPQDFCNIACDSSDNLYVAYLDFRGVVRGTADVAQLHVTKSTNGGGQWSLPIVANKFAGGVGGTCECCKLDIAATASGNISVAFRSNINDKRDIWLARSRDRGMTFDTSIRIQTGTWTINACPTTGPSIAFDQFDNLHFGWCDMRDDSNRAIGYYSVLPLGENQIFLNRSTSRPGLQNVNWPSIAVSRSTGGIAYVYQAGTSPRLRFTFSANGGNTWTQDMPVPDVLGGQQSLGVPVFAGNNLYVVWQEGPNNGSIYFASVSNLPAPAKVESARPVVEPNPSDPTTQARVTWSAPNAAPFVWYSYRVSNLSGDSLWAGRSRDTTVVLPLLGAGTYIFSLNTITSVASSETNTKFTRSTAAVIAEARSDAHTAVNIDHNELTIVSSGASKVMILDILGRCVREATGNGEIMFSRSDLRLGSYFIKIISRDGTKIVPVVLP